MQVVNFYDFARSVQDRFALAVKGEGLPRPMLAVPARPPREAFVWGGTAAGALLVVIALFELGYGDLDASLALQPAGLVALYAIVLAVLALGALRAAAAIWQMQSLPFRPGVYLFPSGVIDATTYLLKVFPLSRLVKVDADDPRSLSLAFPEGASYRFALRGAEHRDQITAAIAEAQNAIEKAHAEQNKSALSSLDPLQDPGFVSPFAPTTPLVRIVPLWIKFAPVLAVVAGAAVSLPLWYLRNRASDGELFAKAYKLQTSAAYRAYIERGGGQKDVKDILLPRAELREAEKEGTVEAIEKYQATHPNSQIKGDVSTALRNAMLVELGKRAKQGTVTALLEFKTQHPHKLVDPELGKAMHAVYVSALDAYRKDAAAYALPFMERLFAYCEQKGSTVEMRFQRKLSLSLEVADSQVKKSPFFMGAAAVPSRHFDEEHAKKREASLGKTLLARFDEGFAPDVLSFRVGAPIGDPEAALPAAITVPTMFIVHTAQVSGASYISSNPRGVFVGLGMMFDVTFRLPDDTKPFKFKWSIWRPPDTTPRTTTDMPFAEAVYEEMATEEYRQFAQKLLALFFKVPDTKGAETKGADTKGAESKPAP